jgi:DNA-binding MarR family transcriptional regulator
MGGQNGSGDAWAELVELHARVSAEVDREVSAATGLGASDLRLLALLGEEPRRMAELSALLWLTRSGVTRAVRRMEEAGYVRRQVPDDDRRSTFTLLTPAGRRALRRATPIHRAAVERHFSRYLQQRDELALRRALGKLRAAYPATAEALPDDGATGSMDARSAFGNEPGPWPSAARAGCRWAGDG